MAISFCIPTTSEWAFLLLHILTCIWCCQCFAFGHSNTTKCLCLEGVIAVWLIWPDLVNPISLERRGFQNDLICNKIKNILASWEGGLLCFCKSGPVKLGEGHGPLGEQLSSFPAAPQVAPEGMVNRGCKKHLMLRCLSSTQLIASREPETGQISHFCG